MTSRRLLPSFLALVILVVGLGYGCVKLDFFLFAGDPASLEDYDFESEDLDGIDPARIHMEMVEVGNSGEEIHVIFVERDLAKLERWVTEFDLDPAPDFDALAALDLTIVYSQGNRGNMLLYWHRLTYLEDMGFNVVIFDYRGRGASDGETSEESTYSDVQQAYDWAVEQVGSEAVIISYGYSMGGGPGLFLCSQESEREISACITESTFSSTEQLIQESMDYALEGSWLLDVEYPNAERAGRLEMPYMLMHGELDQRVSVANAYIIWENARDRNALNRSFIVDGAAHRDYPVPSYVPNELPTEYSYPDEMPGEMRRDLREVYQPRIAQFIVEVLADRQ